ncbi:MAG: tRNA dihydrouridine synthase DusB [Bacteroidales bacterium]|nr:tRNA dihydrouridine synthase DusB [Bacteroidales bacterium]MCF8328401.1 tRNA dihydrouridine synthase DusB [Bacteroidales bacterium]
MISAIKNNKTMPLMLAPMEDITDSTFREICRQHGADMVFTEFISSEALVRDVEKSKIKMHFVPSERPIGIQIFGNDPENMARAAQMVQEKQPDVIDLNFGCPVKKVVSKGGGAALLKDVDLMIRITQEVVKAVGIPVTAKTRLGWDQNSINAKEIAFRLQDAGISMLTLHGRTRSQMYGGHANWDLIGEIAKDRNFEIPLIGNGDIETPEDAKRMKEGYGVSGIMIGRAAMGYPWLFDEIKHFFSTGNILPPPDIQLRISVCRNHLLKSIEIKGEEKGVKDFRKFYRNYFKGISHFKPYRIRLFQANRLDEVETILQEVQANLSA